jgi:hypothetical protein
MKPIKIDIETLLAHLLMLTPEEDGINKYLFDMLDKYQTKESPNSDQFRDAIQGKLDEDLGARLEARPLHKWEVALAAVAFLIPMELLEEALVNDKPNEFQRLLKKN